MMNNKKFFKSVMVLLLIVFLTGCSDIKEIQSLSYVTAIGVDYQDNEYVGYIQLISFQSEATDGGGKPSVWVSETKGQTFDEALSEVYNTAQQKLLWAHVGTILVSDTALKEGFHHIFDVLTRYYELRLTTWIFGTKDSIKEVFSTTSFFDQSALETILHQPMGTYEQNSSIRPLKLQQFARELFEPALTTYLPSISINRKDWENNLEAAPKLEVDGAFFIKNKEYKGHFTLKELKGLRWITPETERAGIQIFNQNGIPDFNIVFEEIDVEIKLLSDKSTGKPEYNVLLRIKGVMADRDENNITNLNEMEVHVRDAIKKEINDLFDLGVETGTDFLQLEHILYRKKHKTWKNVASGSGSDFLKEDLLKDVKLDITLLHTGAIKNRTIKMEDME
ncbi:MAG: Ger(x)C family spore germination protein [Bacillota bacterium]